MSNEGYNPFPGFIHAETTCDLQNAETAGIEEGCLAYVANGVLLPVQVNPNLPFHYYRYTEVEPALPVDGTLVLATVTSGPALQQDGVTPCVGGPSPRLAGSARWILVSIRDYAAPIP